jgi:hypothetical protein
MPRWIWVGLVLGVLALWLIARPGGNAPVAVDAGGRPMNCALPPSFRADDNPRQSDAGGMSPFQLEGAQVTPLAGFSLEARVLSREDYRSGTEATWSPTDLALGWGPMAAPGIADALDVSQGGRWYRYQWGAEGPPLPLQEIIVNSANMHLIPADATVAAAIDAVGAGDTVRMHGWLVRIERPDGWRWTSSTSRTDSGGGACELVYVCAIESE